MERHIDIRKGEKIPKEDMMSTYLEFGDECEQAIPKDKGWAWMCLLGGFMVQFVVVGGGLRAFGVFLVEIQDMYDVTSGAISWIPAMYSSLLLLNAIPANTLVNMFNTRRVVTCGGLISAIGFMLSAYATSVEFLYFSYGFLGGIGGSLAYSPSIVAVGRYFVKRRAFAVGMCFAGSGVGAFVLPPLVSLALTRYGLNGAFLIMAGVSFNLCVCGMLFRPATFYLTRLKRTRHFGAKYSGSRRYERNVVSIVSVDFPVTDLGLRSNNNTQAANIPSTYCMESQYLRAREKPAFDWHVLRNPLLYLYAVPLYVADSSFSNIFNILPSHTQRLGVSRTDAAWIISIVGVADLVSRLCIGGFADLDLFRKRHIFQFSIFGCGLAFCVAPLMTSYPLLAADCVVMSFAAGSFVTLAPVLLAEGLGTENMSTAYGVMNLCGCLPFLLSPAIVSSLRDATGSWNESFILCGMLIITSAILNILGPFCCITARKQLQLADSKAPPFSHNVLRKVKR